MAGMKDTVGAFLVTTMQLNRHKQFKAFELLRNRLAFNQFLNSMQTGLVHEWSMERNPANIDCKMYHPKPIITTKNWTDTFKWNWRNRKCVKLDNVYFVSETKPMINKEDCRVFMEVLNLKPWKTFDEMMASFNSLLQIKINKDSWEIVILII